LDIKKSQSDDVELVEELQKSLGNVKKEVAKVIIGQEETITNLLVSLISRGHCMLVGVPGLAKTLLIKTLSEVLDLEFSRIQFTPDLMPSDITGTEILEEDLATKRREFRFIKGPIFANIILADEINRATELKDTLFPNQNLQERTTNFSEFYLENGEDLIPQLLSTLQPLKGEFTFLVI
jgi:MoxR-like ATPase